MIEKLLELLEKVWTLFAPVIIMNPWQGVVITRFGRVHRVREAGYWLKWPLVEDYHLYEACVTTMRLPPQSLTTKDDRDVVVSSIVKYEVRDGIKYVKDVWDAIDVLADTVMGAIGDYVENHTYAEFRDAAAMKREVLKVVRNDVNDYGFKVRALTFPDKSRTRSLRLVMPNAKDLAN